MESTRDKVAYEDELLHDDSTSCTSSLATSLSEDPDDLYLGAEANSFDFGFSRKDERIHEAPILERKSGNAIVNKLIVCHDRFTSFDSSHTSHTHSSINSVSDLINARECNASEVLVNLGFVVRDEEQTKRDILSRFNYPSFTTTEDTVVEPNDRNDDYNNSSVPIQSTADITESIHKAQEWLTYRTSHQTNDEVGQSAQSGGESGGSGKRGNLPRVFKLRKFSKSRQPSFELLLPKVKEEDASTEVCPREPETPKTPKTATNISDGVFTSDHKTASEHVQSSMSYVTTSRGFQEESRRIDKEEHLHGGLTPHLAKTSLLATGKGESLDLEEIASNEDTSEDHKLRHNTSPQGTRVRRVGVIRQPPHLAPSSVGFDQTPHEGACESDENESSSGFDEDDVNCDVEQQYTPLKISPTKVVDTLQKPSCHSTTFSCHPPTTCQSKYVYDVSSDCAHHVTSSQLNQNNCSNVYPLPSGLTTVKCGKSSSRSGQCILVPQSQVRPKHRLTDARRRRREFAARSALSGDTFIELARSLPQSNMVFKDGSYFYRKRRPGNYSFCKHNHHDQNGYDDVTPDVTEGRLDSCTVSCTSQKSPRHPNADGLEGDVTHSDDVTKEEGRMKKSLSFNGFGHVFSPA